MENSLVKPKYFYLFIFSGRTGERGADYFDTLNTSTSLKRKIIETFHEEILFDPNGKCLIVHSGDVNPYQFIVAILRDKALKVPCARTLRCHHRHYCAMHCANDRLHF